MRELLERLEESVQSKIASVVEKKLGPRLLSAVDFRTDKDGVTSIKTKSRARPRALAYFDLNDDGDSFSLTLVKFKKGRPGYKLDHESVTLPKAVTLLKNHIEAAIEAGVATAAQGW